MRLNSKEGASDHGRDISHFILLSAVSARTSVAFRWALHTSASTFNGMISRMMRRAEVHRCLHVRLFSNWIDLPEGTLATVETVGVLSDRTFYFTVRWLGLRPGTRRRPVSDTSLNFWEDDLKLFEVVSDLEAAIASAPASVYWRWWKHGKKSAKPERPASPQTQLPFPENDVLAVFPKLSYVEDKPLP